MTTLFETLRHHPELAVFLTLAAGFALGTVRIGSFKIGPVLGCLFAGVVIGQVGIDVPPIVKVIFFDLFLFATGYKVGPQFFRGLRKDALPQLALTVIICVACLMTAIAASRILGYDTGTAAGMLAGAFTESTVIGTASEAIQRLGIADAEKTRLVNQIPVAYAVTYLVGTTTIVWFLSSVAPKILRVDLREESRKLSEKISGKPETEPGVDSAFQEWSLRAFRVTGSRWVGRTVADVEKSVPGARVFVRRIRHGGEISDPVPGTVIRAGDVVAVMARRNVMLQELTVIGKETMDRELLDFPVAYREIVITKKRVVDEKLRNLAGPARGVALHKLTRQGQEMPFTPETTVNRGDVLHVSGSPSDLERAAKEIGYLENPSSATDMIFVGLGILLGGFVGLLSATIGGISLSLTTSGGALVMGLVFGWLHSKSRAIGRIPEPALWIFDNVGLATFIGVVGLAAGPGFISGLRQTGISLVFAGLVVAVLPHVIGLLVGRYLLKINPVILLGAQSGAGTMTAALKTIQDAAGSKLPALGYTVPYALGNILLTAWGPVIVALMS